MASWSAVLALTGFHYSGIQKEITFDDITGFYFWSNGYAYGTVQMEDLEKGKKADLIALDLDEIGWVPMGGQDVYTAMVYAVTGQHVRDVMVNGKWLFRNDEWLTVNYQQACADLEKKHTELAKKIK